MSQRRYLLLLICIASLTACQPRASELRLVAPSSDLDLDIANSIATTLERDSSFRLTISEEQLAGEQALDALLSGEADLAVVSNYLPFRDGIATVMPLYPSVLHIAYRDGWDATSAYTLLNNARVFAGAEGSASRLIFERITARLQLPDDAYAFVDELLSGNVDIVVVFAPISPQRVAELDGFKIFSFASPSDIGAGSIIDAATMMHPALRAFIIPESIYGAATKGPVVTVAVDKLLVARDDLDPADVYDFVSTVRRLRPALSANRPGLFDQLDTGFDVSNSTFVVHAGTQNFLQRDEPTIYERYSGVAEVAVTLLIALISAAFAAIRLLKMRRKNRIDEFYSAVIAIRDSIAHDSRHEDRAQARQAVKKLQNTAFNLLVEEKLAADESFQIFITLSNDVLQQLD